MKDLTKIFEEEIRELKKVIRENKIVGGKKILEMELLKKENGDYSDISTQIAYLMFTRGYLSGSTLLYIQD